MKKKTAAVIGLGRVGLPMALFLADHQHQVIGIDIDQAKINLLKKGTMPFMEEGAERILKKYINRSFFPTTDYQKAKEVENIILTLGTPVDANMNPEYDQIDNTLEKISPFLKKNQLLILRSTVAPRTTLYAGEFIEKKTKFKIGENFFIAFCPERIAEGKALKELKEIPQIIGGIDNQSTKKAFSFFTDLGIKSFITDSVSAELAKLFTNMYRYISFAIANEFMVIAENFHRNIYEIIELVNRDYKRGGLVLPGLTAGPCLFKDGFFLINENPFLDLIVASWKINEALPLFLIKKLRERIKLQNKKVTILGLAFKPEIDDIRESLSFKIRKALLREQAKVILHDPYVKFYRHQEIVTDLKKALKNIDVVVVATRHKQYIKEKEKILGWLARKTYVVDIWNIFRTNKLIFRV
ncbi:MAG: nucleotide sugar dehydrogenase [Microgenomates group bacterium]|nr:nucleotide sugar dehydrogenase [Microgenomates group bacterium]